MSDDDESPKFGVEKGARGRVSILLGDLPPFEIPAESAIKFACLLLKNAGATVVFSAGRILATYKVSKLSPSDDKPRLNA